MATTVSRFLLVIKNPQLIELGLQEIATAPYNCNLYGKTIGYIALAWRLYLHLCEGLCCWNVPCTTILVSTPTYTYLQSFNSLMNTHIHTCIHTFLREVFLCWTYICIAAAATYCCPVSLPLSHSYLYLNMCNQTSATPLQG